MQMCHPNLRLKIPDFVRKSHYRYTFVRYTFVRYTANKSYVQLLVVCRFSIIRTECIDQQCYHRVRLVIHC